jgi:putative transposase
MMYRFWQPGPGYDRNVWSLDELREKVDYIHANPIRRKLVDGPADWVWSSYRAWETGENEPVTLDRESFPVITT